MYNIIKILSATLALTSFSTLDASDDYVIGDTSIYSGVWTTEKSASELHINVVGSYFEILMIDKSKHNRIINISNPIWDGEHLSFSSYCVANDWTVNHSLTLKKSCSKNRCSLILMDNFTGSPRNSSMVWEKK